jgi:hypothetical protein
MSTRCVAIRLSDIDGFPVYKQVSSRLEVGSWILTFFTNKNGDLSIREPELSEVAESGSSCLPLALVRVGFINES